MRDFWGKIIEFQTKKNFTNNHTHNFKFFKSSTFSSNLSQVDVSHVSLSEMNNDQDGGKNPKHQQIHTFSTAVFSTVEECYFLCLI